MKILYAIQGTGNGHISRAQEIIPHLLNYGHVDLLVSGTQADVGLPYIIKYKKPGISYTFGKRGGIDFIDTIKKLRPFDFIKDIYQFPVHEYDVILNDFEPITAWACKLKNKYCFGLSHQAAYLSNKTPRADNKNFFAEWVFKFYAPVNDKIGFHFKAYDTFITTPVIRSVVRQQYSVNNGHITVYLPAYADEMLLKHFNAIKDVEWHVFSKHSKRSYIKGNVKVYPVQNMPFVKSLASSNGLLTNGGFESPAEAIYLHKKVLAIPMQNQYEQQCNAKALKLMGGTVVNKVDNDFTNVLKNWLTYACPVKASYTNHVPEILDGIFSKVTSKLHVA
ncbi:MAG: glycosyltransferase family protein [Bacteroidia bacterium]